MIVNESIPSVQPLAEVVPITLRPGSFKKGRTLLGWIQAHPGDSGVTTPLDKARNAVASRPMYRPAENVTQAAPQEVDSHVNSQLNQNIHFAELARQGFTVVLADLSKICAIQPQVAFDHASLVTSAAIKDDWKSLAAITLPINQRHDIDCNLDALRGVYTLSSASFNLQQHQFQFNGGGALIFNFGVRTSFVQVGKLGDRYLLRDGYHRAVGLIEKGIHLVPVIYKEYQTVDEFNVGLPPSGLFSRDVYLSERPPYLVDFLDDAVSAAVDIRAMKKVIMLSVVETAIPL